MKKGHHIIKIDGRPAFQSDKYFDVPEIGPNKIVLSFNDLAAQKALRAFILWTDDRDLAKDIETVLDDMDSEAPS